MKGNNKALGAAGEAAAEAFLRRLGYTILHRNLRISRLGELDLVALDKSVLVFVEVKAKHAGEVLGGFANITASKQRKLRELAQAYLQLYPRQIGGARFDAVEVEYGGASAESVTVRHLLDAFR